MNNQRANKKSLQILSLASFSVGLSCLSACSLTPNKEKINQVTELKKPNILIISCDQLSARATKLYNPNFANTPNIDRILDKSMNYSQAYTVCPLCMPARAAMWSGKYPHETNILTNVEPPEQFVNLNSPTLGEVFSNANYDTVHFGKKHDAGALRGFKIAPDEVATDLTSELPINKDSFFDVTTTANMVNYLKNNSKQPFLAVADLNNPHNICQFVGENEKLKLPDLEKLPELPVNFECQDWETRPVGVRHICCTHPRQRQTTNWSREHYRHYLYAYARYMEMVDRQVGEILQALEEANLSDNTIIIFTADHGENMAAFGLVTKHLSFYQNAINIPLSIYNPKKPNKKGVSKRLVSNLDLFPTLCELANIEAPAHLSGSSILSGEPPRYVVSEWTSEYFNTVSPGRMLLDKEYKYIHYLEGNGEELYDLVNDPYEMNNLAPKTEKAEILLHYRKLLAQHLEKTNDDYFKLPVFGVEAYRLHKGKLNNHTGSDAITDGNTLYPNRGKENLLKFEQLRK